jgi:light-regulated signal transduction histidine kinase (bacteriophytochrome)
MTSSFEPVYKKTDSTHAQEPAAEFDPAKHVSPVVAHELNNILTIVQGYADRLIMKHPNDATLQAQLKSISDAARRAATIIRDASPQIYVSPARQTTPSVPEPAAA